VAGCASQGDAWPPLKKKMLGGSAGAAVECAAQDEASPDFAVAVAEGEECSPQA